ncbi:MAG: FUSC family membrane protein [Aquabacterium sp.]
MPRLVKPIATLPAPVLNGLSVGAGLACLMTLIGLTAGMPAAITAASGAAATSVADTVCAPQAKRWQMVPAVVSSSLVAALVAFSHPCPALLTAVLLLTILTSIMWMSWGKRGGPQTFVMVLTLVFQMAAFSQHQMSWPQVWQHLSWVVAGALGMAAWSELSIRALARRYRTLALADSLDALADMMQAQAQWTREQGQASPTERTKDLLALITQQAGIADVLQHARDLLYSQADDARPDALTHRQIEALVHTVNLRDVVQACQLDLDRLPAHAHAGAALETLAAQLTQHAHGLHDMAAAWRLGRRCAAPSQGDTAPLAESDEPILQSLVRRRRHMQALMGLIAQAHDASGPTALAHSPPQARILLTLVSPSNWRLAPLKTQLHGQSPVLRYAVRATLAVACADAIAHVLPWASHPHWILMTVAVVMRGNLEQTLARRDARIQGTLIGCLLASSIITGAGVHTGWLFLVLAISLSLAHGFVMINYRVTAASGAVLALVQGHLFSPGHHPALIDAAERLGDTLIGAMLAWGFSYVLPSWERRQLPDMVDRLLRAQAHYAHHALRWHEEHAETPRRSHARREVYDVLWLLTQSLQRMGKEPRHARAWAPSLETLVVHSHRLISHLAAIKGLLTVRHASLDASLTDPALTRTVQRITAMFKGEALSPPVPPATAPVADEVLEDAIPHTGHTDSDDLTAWLHQRLQQAEQEARLLSEAARSLRQP